MKILLADGRPGLLSAVRLLLEQDSQSWEITGEAANVQELDRLLLQTQPDLLLVDWELPGFPLKPLPITRHPMQFQIFRLHEEYPALHIVIMSGKPEARLEALQYGASGFISKGDPPEVVLETLQKAIPKGAV